MAATVLRFIGSNNGYLPTPTKTAVGFVRDPWKYRINDYVQNVHSPTPMAYFTKLSADDYIRTPAADAGVFADGDWRPMDRNNGIRLKTVPIETMRFNDSMVLGYQAIENTNLVDLKPLVMLKILNQHMLRRYRQFYAIADTSATYGSNTASATSAGGGKWDAGTIAAPYFKRGLLAGVEAVNLATNGMVTPSDMMLILSPSAARKIGGSEEMWAWYGQSVYSKAMSDDPHESVNRSWGLPPMYQGVKIIVEPTLGTVSAPTEAGTDNATRTRFKSEDNAILCSRVGGLEGPQGAPSFSTFQMFYYGDAEQQSAQGGVTVPEGSDRFLSTYAFDEPKHKLVWLNVESQFVFKAVSPESGYYFTDIIT